MSLLLRISILVSVLILSALTACNRNTNDGSKSDEQEMSRVEAQLHKLAKKIESSRGQGKCTKDSDCRIMGLGSKFCDLYKDFLVFSIQDASESEVRGFVEEFNRFHKVVSDRSLAVNRCGRKPASIRCEASQCRPDIR
jgi:hypothetical protein